MDVLMSSLRSSQCCLLFPYMLFVFLIFKVPVMTRLLRGLLKLFGKFLQMSTVDGSRHSHVWVPVLPAPVLSARQTYLGTVLSFVSHQVPQLGSEFRVLSFKKKKNHPILIQFPPSNNLSVYPDFSVKPLGL